MEKPISFAHKSIKDFLDKCEKSNIKIKIVKYPYNPRYYPQKILTIDSIPKFKP